jgi:hypothetical protein
MVMPTVRKQRYRCRACGRLCRQNPTPHAYPQARREEILHASSRTRDTKGASDAPLVSLVPRSPVGSPKRSSASAFVDHAARCRSPRSHVSHPATLSADGSCVLKKAHASWIGIALCRQRRQVVASAVGDRSLPDVSAVVGGHCRGISPRAWRDLLLGSRQGSDPGGAAHGGGLARREKRPTSSAGTLPSGNASPVLCA